MVTTVADVNSLDAGLDGQFEAANNAVKACTGMAASDVTNWSTFYAQWKAIHVQWVTLRAGGTWYNAGGLAAELLFYNGVYTQMQQIATMLPSYQATITKACPGYTATPLFNPDVKNKPDDDPNDLANKLMGWAKVAGTVALLGGGLYAALKVVEIGEAISVGHKAAKAAS
jgi:hypothetical protein